MFVESEVGSVTIAPQVEQLGEQEMVHQERWAEIRRLRFEERISVSEIARRLDLDRKTVRRCLRQSEWRPYERLPRAETLLTEHAQFLAGRAAQVNYSARILYQELRSRRGYRGSYDTVKRFVAPGLLWLTYEIDWISYQRKRPILDCHVQNVTQRIQVLHYRGPGCSRC